MSFFDFTKIFGKLNFHDSDFIYFFNKQIDKQYIENSRDQMIERSKNKEVKNVYDDLMYELTRYAVQSTAFIYNDEILYNEFKHRSFLRLVNYENMINKKIKREALLKYIDEEFRKGNKWWSV